MVQPIAGNLLALATRAVDVWTQAAEAACQPGLALLVTPDSWVMGYRCDDTYEWGPERRLALVLS